MKLPVIRWVSSFVVLICGLMFVSLKPLGGEVASAAWTRQEVPQLASVAVDGELPNDIENPSFETGDLTGWTVLSGNAFTDAHVSDATDWGWGCCFNHEGTYHYWGAAVGGDPPTGEMKSSDFVLGGTGEINFLIGGGNDIERLYVALVRAEDDAELMRATNTEFDDSERYHRVTWDASAYLGETLYLLVVDHATGGWGHINVDDFRVYTLPHDIENPGFETGDLTGWTVLSGDAFTDAHVSDATDWGWGCCFNHEGTYHYWGAAVDGDAPTGEMKSSDFVLGGTGEINFLIGGGNDIERLYVSLMRVADDAELIRATNTEFDDSERYHRVTWDASAYLGETLYLLVVDHATGGWGHINVDDFRVYNVLPNDIENPGFETGDLTGWTVLSGDAFTDAHVTNATDWGWGCCFNHEGTYHYWGAAVDGDAPTGEMKSSDFVLAGNGHVNFLVGGGDDIDKLYVALVRASDGAELFKATGQNEEAYRRVHWDAIAHYGEILYIKVVDNSSGGWGHINVDDFTVNNQSEGVVQAHWPFDEGAGHETQDVAGGATDHIHYVFNEALYKPDSDPLWRDGITDNALLFDGYSTWIRREATEIVHPREALTIEAWVAPRSYEWGDLGQLSAIVNQHNRANREGYILGMGRHGRWSFQAGGVGAWYQVWAEDDIRLETDTWSYIVATFDQQSQLMRLYLNGAPVGQTPLPRNAVIAPSTEPFLIAKHNQAAVIGGVFTANMFNGLIDELKIHTRALSEEEVGAIYQSYVESFKGQAHPQPDTEPQRSRYDGDRYRPQYHFIAPEHWMNEPHAPIHFEGKYHIFFQHNPQGPYWHQIHWGHAVSDDMVHWNDLPIALAPDDRSIAPDGVWSGSATFDENGLPVLFITAGDDSALPNQMTGLAESTYAEDGDIELKRWILHDQPVTVQEPDLWTPVGEVWFGQFRDPFVWKELDAEGNPIWYQLMGSGIREEGGAGYVGGTALLYSSRDLYNWTYHRPFFIGDYGTHPETGQVWELPVLLPLGPDSEGNEKHVFLINPWYDHYNPFNVRFVWYWIGTWDRDSYQFIPDHEEPLLLDYGDHFTGPSGMVDGHGRSIVFSISQDRRTEQAHYDAGWAHNAGLPIIVSLLEDDTLGVQPIPELASLRVEQLASFADTSLAEANQLLEGVGGDLLEIRVELEALTTAPFGISLRRSPDGEEETLLFYDPAHGTFNVDRNRSSLDPDARKGIHGGALPLDGSTLSLHIYLDRSMLEAYANGRKSITTRVYPVRPDSMGLQMWGGDGVTIRSMEVWALGSAYGPTVPPYYDWEPAPPHGELPNHSFQTGDLSGWIVEEGNAFTDDHITDADDWGWGGPFLQADDGAGYHYWGFHPDYGDAATGRMDSQRFVLGGNGWIDFLIAGGNDIENLYLGLVRVSDGQILFSATGHNSEQYRRVRWDASAYLGEELHITIVDSSTGGFGHINVDDVNVPTADGPTVVTTGMMRERSATGSPFWALTPLGFAALVALYIRRHKRGQ